MDNENIVIKPITEVCLNVTEACNLACRYCFTEHNPNYMTLDIAKDAAKWLYNNAQEATKIKGKEVVPTIGFFGGEPTLMWDTIIVPLVNWIKDQNWKFNLGITSNCVLMTQDKVDFLVENNMGLLLSMDGNKNTQDYNRPCKNSIKSSFDIVDKNLDYIAQKLPNTTYRATIIPATAEHLFENLMYAGNKGFANVFAIINEFEEWDEEARKIVEREINKYALYIIDTFRRGEENFVKLRPFEQAINKIVSINQAVVFVKDIEHIGPGDHHRCGLGDGYGSINYKGDIFACQEVASRKGEKDIFYIGNIYDGINEERLQNLRNSFLNRPQKVFNHLDKNKCIDCPSRFVCNANFCHVNNYILYQNFAEMPDCWCWWNNLLLEKAQMVLEILGYHRNEAFKNYFIDSITQQGGPLHYDD